MNLNKNGKECLLCHKRKKLVIITPEEKIRQNFLLELITKYQVPLEMIDVEVPLSYYGKGLKGRVDIIVSGLNKQDEKLHPLMIVECKEPNTPLTDSVLEQAINYDEILEPKVTAVTNGEEIVIFQWDELKESYFEIEQIPIYNELIDKDYFNPKDEVEIPWIRPDHLGPSSQQFKDLIESDLIGEDSQSNLHSFFINLIGLLQEYEVVIPSLSIRNSEFIQDYGLRFMSFGNATGGAYTGDYRSILLKDANSDNQIASVSLMGRGKVTNHPLYGNSKGHTLLLVAIEDNNKSHLSLELALDRYISFLGGIYTIWHDGTLTVGKKGRVKNQEVIDFIQEKMPALIKDNRVILGKLDNSRPFTWTNNDVNEFISNLIDYALLRDQFRQTK